MPWYFYNGQVPVPVETEAGAVQVVAPRSKVLASHKGAARHGASMRRCAGPSSAEHAKPEPLAARGDISPSRMGQAIKELGKVSSPDAVAPPVVPRVTGVGDEVGLDVEPDDEAEAGDKPRRRSRSKQD